MAGWTDVERTPNHSSRVPCCCGRETLENGQERPFDEINSEFRIQFNTSKVFPKRKRDLLIFVYISILRQLLRNVMGWIFMKFWETAGCVEEESIRFSIRNSPTNLCPDGVFFCMSRIETS